MCLAVPFRIVSVDGNDAAAEHSGVRRGVRLDFLPGVVPGDYVMVHAGFAIERVRAEQAEEDLAAFAELEEALRG